MNILVIGSGGREHAIVKTLKRSPSVKKIWCAPGNGGISQDAECVPLSVESISELVFFAKQNKVDLTMVGPEVPLVLGIVDHFERENLAIIGPSRRAARLEGSKSYAKCFMEKYGIPTARYDIIPNLIKGSYQLQHWPGRSVVKADGLAAGKGVKVCETQAEAKEFLYDIMEKEIFGGAGDTAIIEECLDGYELTILAFCDGKTLIPMPASQDHKRLLDGDQGPNTGGMGAYAPTPQLTPALLAQIEETVFKPFLKGLADEKLAYRGIIYFGLMITKNGPSVLEFNIRFGDPETQVVLPLLDSDFGLILKALAENALTPSLVQWKKEHSFSVVLASGGYPGSYETGNPIRGLNKASLVKDVQIFHAGTKKKDDHFLTSGGRVLNITATGHSFEDARNKAYEAISHIEFDGMFYRKDIGHRVLKKNPIGANA